MPRSDSFIRFGHVATQSCATAVPGSTRNQDRHVVDFSEFADINVKNGIKVQPSMRGAPPRSRFAKASRLLKHRKAVPQPTSAATGVAPQ